MSGRTKNSTIAANIARQKAFRSPTLENLLTEPGVQPANPKERRDIRRVLEHWVQHASSDDGIPALDNFDFCVHQARLESPVFDLHRSERRRRGIPCLWCDICGAAWAPCDSDGNSSSEPTLTRALSTSVCHRMRERND